MKGKFFLENQLQKSFLFSQNFAPKFQFSKGVERRSSADLGMFERSSG
jgi:hypothetical protein